MDNQIEEMLSHFSDNGLYHKPAQAYIVIRKITYTESLHVMMKLGIITKANTEKDIYELTAFGFQIRRCGGWIEYNRQLQEDKKRERDNIEASIRTNNTLNRTIRLTIGIGAVAALGTLGQWLLPLKESTNIEPKYQMQTQHHCHCFCHTFRNTKHSHATNDTTHEKILK